MSTEASTPPPASTTGLLLVGHGTRNRQGQQQFLRLADQVRANSPSLLVEPAFLELAEPDIEFAARRLAERGCQQFVTVPLLLFEAGHAKQDIPEAVQAAADRNGLVVTRQTAPLNHHPLLIELSSQLFLETLNLEKDRDDHRAVALVMAGRGSSDRAAVRMMRKLTLKRREATPVSYAGTCFFAVAKPRIEQLLEYVSRRPEPIVVLQPHLLFDGELWQTALELAQNWQVQMPTKRWLVVPPLGSDDRLAKLLIQLQAAEIHDSDGNRISPTSSGGLQP